MSKSYPKGNHMNPLQRAKAASGRRRALSVFAVAVTGATLIAGLAAIPASAASQANGGVGPTVKYFDVQTGWCLDSNDGGAAYTLACNGGNYQNWYAVGTSYQGGDAFTLNDAQTGRCLDSNYNGNVYTSPCDGNNTYENWTAGLWMGDGYQWFNFQTGRCLDSNYNGDLYTLACNGGNYQNWNGRY